MFTVYPRNPPLPSVLFGSRAESYLGRPVLISAYLSKENSIYTHLSKTNRRNRIQRQTRISRSSKPAKKYCIWLSRSFDLFTSVSLCMEGEWHVRQLFDKYSPSLEERVDFEHLLKQTYYYCLCYAIWRNIYRKRRAAREREALVACRPSALSNSFRFTPLHPVSRSFHRICVCGRIASHRRGGLTFEYFYSVDLVTSPRLYMKMRSG